MKLLLMPTLVLCLRWQCRERSCTAPALTEWALGTWERLRTIRVSEHVPDVSFPFCLAMSGSMLVCGGYRNDSQYGFVLVLDTQAMTCEHVLHLDGPVNAWLILRGEVWGLLVWKDCNRFKTDKVVV